MRFALPKDLALPRISVPYHFQQEYMGIWVTGVSEDETRYREMALEYCQRTEEFDRKVCTGPVVRDAIRPAGGDETSSINRNATRVLQSLSQRERDEGRDWSSALWRDALRWARQNFKFQPETK